jgi:CheY-like chemotaxis protein
MTLLSTRQLPVAAQAAMLTDVNDVRLPARDFRIPADAADQLSLCVALRGVKERRPVAGSEPEAWTVADANATARQARGVGIVGDDAAARESLRLLLGIAGLRVLAYAAAEAYLADREGREGDCLLADQHMPHCTGLEWLDQLQSRARPIPAAPITGSPSADLRGRAARINVAHVWEKPLAEAALLAFAAGEGAKPA